ncbi:hypothetical protein HK102_007357 [Quaeritorhiza haematococci]|nr:hypothetical protein HK102_007357 [Quaeritorhiza haematococci]
MESGRNIMQKGDLSQQPDPDAGNNLFVAKSGASSEATPPPPTQHFESDRPEERAHDVAATMKEDAATQQSAYAQAYSGVTPKGSSAAESQRRADQVADIVAKADVIKKQSSE